MPLAQAIAAKTKEVQAHDVLCATNSTARQRLETELTMVQKELAKQQGFLKLCETQLKATLAEIPKLEKIIKDKATKPADKVKAEASLKAAQVKLKGLKEQEPKLKKLVQQLDGEAKANNAAWNKIAAEVKALAARKNALAAEMAALQVKLKQAQAIDAYTYDVVLGNPAMLKDLGVKTHNEEICGFILNGPKGNKATFEKYIKTDEINLNGKPAIRDAFMKLAATERAGTPVDWSHAPWDKAHEYCIQTMKQDGSILHAYKAILKTQKGLD